MTIDTYNFLSKSTVVDDIENATRFLSGEHVCVDYLSFREAESLLCALKTAEAKNLTPQVEEATINYLASKLGATEDIYRELSADSLIIFCEDVVSVVSGSSPKKLDKELLSRDVNNLLRRVTEKFCHLLQAHDEIPDLDDIKLSVLNTISDPSDVRVIKLEALKEHTLNTLDEILSRR
jgi:hypothetical protein